MTSKYFYAALATALIGMVGCDEPKKDAPATNGAEKPADKPADKPAEKPAEKPATNNATNSATNSGAAGTAAQGAVNFAEVDPATLNEKAPDKFAVKFETTAGDFTVDLTREWAPNGVDRFYNLVKNGYFVDIAAFRVIGGFMAQFGIHGDPAVNNVWKESSFQDDPQKPGVSNKPGYLTFAKKGTPNSRSVQLFINYGDNKMLDPQGFTPIGKVAGNGMDVVKKWHAGYGEGAPRGKGPDQGRVQSQGNSYLKENFPEMTYIKAITLTGDAAGAAAADKPAVDKPAPKAFEAGGYTHVGITEGGVEGGKFRISLKDDGSAVGSFQGKREGKGFSIPFKGTIDDKGVLNATGSKGKSDLTIKGRFNSGEVHGSVQGKINDKGLRATFKAKK